MVRRRKKLLIGTLLLGWAITLIVLLLNAAGRLSGLDNWYYDLRAKHAQRHAPAPTTQLIHVDIDDRAMEVIGQFPWPRARFAAMLDELTRANARWIATDIIFSDAQAVSTEKSDAGELVTVDNDARLAESIAKSARVILPAALFNQTKFNSGISLNAIEILKKEPELTESQLIDRLRAGGVPSTKLEETAATIFYPARREAIYQRIYEILNSASAIKSDSNVDKKSATNTVSPGVTTSVILSPGNSTSQSVIQSQSDARGDVPAIADSKSTRSPNSQTERSHKIITADDCLRQLLKLPGDDINFSSPLTATVLRQFDKAESIIALQKMMPSIPMDAPPIISSAGEFLAPRAAFGKGAVGTGFVDLFNNVVRSVPLLAAHDGRLYPSLGFSLALHSMNVSIDRIRFTKDSIVVPREDGNPLVIPVHADEIDIPDQQNVKHHQLLLSLDIPWFGTSHWEAMYDFPQHLKSSQHVPILQLYQASELARRIRKNNISADTALSVLLDNDQPYKLGLEVERARRYAKNLPGLEDVDTRITMAMHALKELETSSLEKTFSALQSSPSFSALENQQYQELLTAKKTLSILIRENQQLALQLLKARSELAAKMTGKSVIIGWTATGMAADHVTTPLHQQCPGVIVHGAVFNSITTSYFWKRLPDSLLIVITILLSTSVALITGTFSAVRGVVASLMLIAGFVLIDAFVLFEKYHLLLPVAAPCLSASLIWIICTIHRTISETREREHIKSRFQAYVDPMLVNYVLDHPEKATLKGEIKEMTVLFSDLAGFSALSEQLGEDSVTLLNEYLGRMVPVIRRNNGFVNKFLGDGVMCFFGAPVDNPNHARDAVQTALEMQQEVELLNKEFIAKGLPALSLRIGVSTGRMVVGDAGADDCSDYTVLGNAVNLGSRLEGANKYLGTSIIVSASTASSCSGQFLFRPLGKIRVVGIQQGVEVFEPLEPVTRATELHRQLIELTETMLDQYRGRMLSSCLQTLDAIDQSTGGNTKLTDAYRNLCSEHIQRPQAQTSDSDSWDETISLHEK